MTSIALFGAGGKMGHRLSRNLKDSAFTLRHVEVSEQGRARLAQDFGVQCVSPEVALSDAQVAILAVPDTHIGKVAQSINHLLKPGTIVVVLDAAAPFAGHLPERPDLTYFVTHPCHPPIFNDETDPNAKLDRFGGIAAKQHIVSALMQGPEEHYALGEEVARTIWAPVMRSHRVTVEQMALLEPKLAILDETDSGLDIDALRVVAGGVNQLANKDNAVVLVTHYQRLLNYIVPDYVHVMESGRVIKTGGKELALELETRGYDWVRAEYKAGGVKSAGTTA